MSDPDSYYLSRKSSLLKDYDRYSQFSRGVLLNHFSEGTVQKLVVKTRQEYERIIPNLPYIGGKQPFTQFVINTGLLLAVYRTLREHGKNLEESGQLVFAICSGFMQAYPSYLTKLMGFLNFSPLYLHRLRVRALESHQRKYADDYVFNFITGDGQTFDYGVDYLECASCKYLAKQGALDFARYLCPVDVLYSQTLGWGLRRTMTLAEGAEKCDFRFKKGGETGVAVPEALERYFKKPATES